MLDLSSLKVKHSTLYLLSEADEIRPENADCDQSLPASPAAFVIYPPERKRRKMSAVRKRLLDSVTDYLYSRAQKVHTAEERDAFTLALAIMEAVRHDAPQPFEAACYRAFGSSLKVYLKRRAEKQWLQHQGLVSCIPDYDPKADKRLNLRQAKNRLSVVQHLGQDIIHGQDSPMMELNRQEALNAQVVQSGEVRGQPPQRGTVHQMPQPTQPPVQKPLRKVPPDPAAKDA